MPRPITKLGRLLRGGAAIVVHDNASPALRDAAASLNTITATLRAELDAIANDELATPKERRRDSQKAVEMAKQSFARVVGKVAAAKEAVGGSIQALRDVQYAFESKLGPVGVERIKRRGDAIAQAGPDAMSRALQEFEQKRDLDGLLALSLNGDDAPLRAFARVARPQTFQQIQTDLPGLTDLLRHSEAIAGGIDELAANDDAHAAERSTGADLLERANQQAMRDQLPPTWPGWAL
jgi:hypothetical protein